MSNAILAQSITRQNVGNALRLMRHECRYNSAEVTALNKAGLELEASPWQYDGELLVITSRTTANTRYTVAYSGCSCKAGQNGRPCWHMAAFLLIQRAAQLALTPAKPKMTNAEYERVLALCDEL
ncbi:MAG: SWIM zinc finger family protein [Chloroflexota bacterium]|nr:SWIM zinc finger family protein [Chloroflexota bacterium]